MPSGMAGTPVSTAGRKTSKFLGVSWTQSGKWYAQIKHHGKNHGLGLYAIEEEAAHAFDTAARMVST